MSGTISSDVIVVGGGPAGLTAALLAARAGRSVTLLEASVRLGGMSASPTVGGHRVDLGSHRLHPSASGPTRRLLDELLGEDLQVRMRNGRLRMDDRWVGFPLRTGALLATLPVRTSAGIGWDLLGGWARQETDRDTYADVVRARLGPTVLDRFHGPYAEKLYGVPAEQIAGELARRRIALTGGRDVLRRLRRSATPAGRTFLYPRRGYGQIVERLAEAAADAGAQIITGVQPSVVVPDPARPVVELSDGRTLDGGRILWTASPTALAGAACQTPPTGALAHRGLVLVYLILDRDRYDTWDAHYVPDRAVPFVRLSEPGNYRDGPDPSGTTVLCAEVPCSPGDDVWQAEDVTLGLQVADGMARIGLPSPGAVETVTIRLPRVYPVFGNADVTQVQELLDRVESLDGITVLGRQGLAVADNLHHVMDMARLAVECLTGGPPGDTGWDGAAWALARAGFATHIIED